VAHRTQEKRRLRALGRGPWRKLRRRLTQPYLRRSLRRSPSDLYGPLAPPPLPHPYPPTPPSHRRWLVRLRQEGLRPPLPARNRAAERRRQRRDGAHRERVHRW
jgi:hypothetical protein